MPFSIVSRSSSVSARSERHTLNWNTSNSGCLRCTLEMKPRASESSISSAINTALKYPVVDHIECFAGLCDARYVIPAPRKQGHHRSRSTRSTGRANIKDFHVIPLRGGLPLLLDHSRHVTSASKVKPCHSDSLPTPPGPNHQNRAHLPFRAIPTAPRLSGG